MRLNKLSIENKLRSEITRDVVDDGPAEFEDTMLPSVMKTSLTYIVF